MLRSRPERGDWNEAVALSAWAAASALRWRGDPCGVPSAARSITAASLDTPVPVLNAAVHAASTSVDGKLLADAPVADGAGAAEAAMPASPNLTVFRKAFLRASSEAGSDAGSEAGPEARVEAGAEMGAEMGDEASDGIEASDGPEVRVEAGAETGAEASDGSEARIEAGPASVAPPPRLAAGEGCVHDVTRLRTPEPATELEPLELAPPEPMSAATLRRRERGLLLGRPASASELPPSTSREVRASKPGPSMAAAEASPPCVTSVTAVVPTPFDIMDHLSRFSLKPAKIGAGAFDGGLGGGLRCEPGVGVRGRESALSEYVLASDAGGDGLGGLSISMTVLSSPELAGVTSSSQELAGEASNSSLLWSPPM